MKKILVTSDLSEDSFVAVEFAKQLQTLINLDVTLFSVFQDPSQTIIPFNEVPILNDPLIVNELRQNILQNLIEIGNKYFLPGNYHYQLLDGLDIANTIVEFAEKNKFDLIIMATHGRTGLARLVIGSVTEKVVRLSKIPVLSVPPKKN